ncbi:MAG: CBS domain-containing protein [Betaproteobacteria bacterium]|nr:CBS domain-containing protein [Betaproteobacteria bacterium]
MMARSAPIPTPDPSTVIEVLRRHEPFASMDQAHVARVVAHGTVVEFRDGENVLDTGESPRHLHIVLQGSVQVGDDTGLALEPDLPEGSLFPLGALLSGRAAGCPYRAAAATRCLALPADAFRELLDQSPELRRFCSERVASQLEDVLEAARGSQALRRADQQPLSQPLSRLIRRKPVTCGPETPLGAVLEAMQREEIGSMIVCEAGGAPVGIFTLYDVLFRVAFQQPDLDQPVANLMSREMVSLAPNAPAYEATLAMARHRIRHILVVEGPELLGVVSERDLFSLQQVSLRIISQGIRNSASSNELVRWSAEIRQLALNMVIQDVAAEQVIKFVSTLNEMLTRRVIEVETAGIELPGVRVCWIGMGSQGRSEQTVATDQDNGIIFVTPEGMEPDRVRERLLPAANRVNQTLDRCGFPLCKGNIMAGNPDCCLSLEEWKRKFARWMHRMDAPELLNATIFFDFRAIHGDPAPAAELRDALHALIEENRFFVKRMVETALDNSPPLGFIRDFVVSDKEGQPHTLDLKVNGVTHFVDAARIFCLTAKIHETNTPRRLRAVGRKWKLDAGQVEGWIQAFYYIQGIRLKAHQDQIARGKPLSNRVDPDRLNKLERRILKEAFRQGRSIQSLMEKLYQF